MAKSPIEKYLSLNCTHGPSLNQRDAILRRRLQVEFDGGEDFSARRVKSIVRAALCRSVRGTPINGPGAMH